MPESLWRDMPCRKRFIAVSVIVVLGLALVTFSQFNHIYYSFDENNFYQREPLFWLSTAIPMLGALLVVSIIIQYRRQISTSQLLVMISYLVLPLMGGLIQTTENTGSKTVTGSWRPSETYCKARLRRMRSWEDSTEIDLLRS